MNRIRCKDCGTFNESGNVYCKNCSGQLYINCYEEDNKEKKIAMSKEVF